MKKRSFSLWRIALITAAILVILYAAAGFFFLPSYLKSKMQEEISSRTGMEATIGGLKINPFALSLTLEDFSLAGKDRESVFALKRLYLNFEMRSIFAKAAVFSEIAIDSPYVHVKIRRDGTTNLPSFAGADSAAAAKPADTAKASDEGIAVVVDRFILTRGRTIYEDRSYAKPRTARFDSLNLTLNDFTTRPNEKGQYSFDASTDRGEKLSWQGTIQAAPFKSAGTIALAGIKARTIWEFMEDRLKFELTDGELSAKADYAVDASGRTLAFALHRGEMTARSVRLIDNETKTEQAALAAVSLSGVELDYGKQSIRIGTIGGTGAELHTERDVKGTLSLPELLIVLPDPRAPKPAPKEPPWKIAIDRIRLKDYSVTIADQNTIPATEIELAPVSVEIDHYTVLSSKPAALAVSGGMKPKGSFTVRGTFTDLPVTATLALSCADIQLPVFQRFVEKSASLIVESGGLGVNGKLTYAARKRDTTMNFAGSAAISSFRAVDPLVNRDFLRWRLLKVQNIAFASLPASLSISEIDAQEPYIRFIIDSTGVSNLQRIVGVKTDTTQQAATKAAAPDTLARAQAQTPTKIGLVRIMSGSANFADYSLSPNFAVGIQELNGTIDELNSEALTHAEMSLDGKVDRYAPVEIRGQINPLSDEAYTDVTMKFHNIELTTFTPYFGKFAGYKIDKGKLSLDLHYKLNKRVLEAENAIVIDQLTLGEKVEGPDVTSLPIRLAVALLKDSKGVIDLDLPVKGSLNDPEFSVFPIILKVLVNLLSKAVLSPFKLLGSLVGGGDEDLSEVQFRAGIDTLETAEHAKLDALVKALNERPGLRLEVRGLVADSLDRYAVAESRLLKQVRARGGKGATLTDEDNDRILQLYAERFKTDAELLVPEAKDKDGDEAEQERQALIVKRARQKITESLLPDDDALLGLARRRAMAVKDRLVFKSGIEEGRIFLLDFQKGAKAENGFVQMPLSLDAR